METKVTENWMPVKDYAELLGKTVQAVYYDIKNGHVKSRKIGTYTLVLKA